MALVFVIIKLGLGLASLVPPIMAVAGALFGLSAPLLPIYAIIAAVTAFAVAVFLIWRNWGKIDAWFRAKFEAVKAAFTDGIDKLWNSLPEWFRNVLKGAAFMVKLGWNASPAGMATNAVRDLMTNRAQNRNTAAVGRAAGGGQQSVGGQVNVSIEDNRTRVTSVESTNPNVPLLAGYSRYLQGGGW